jgi:hypothetical protein
MMVLNCHASFYVHEESGPLRLRLPRHTTRARYMRSLNFTWASRGRRAVVLSGTSITGAGAPALEEPCLPGALHSHNSCGNCARCRGSSGLRGAIRHRSARTCAVIRAVERGKSRYRPTKSDTTAPRPASRADGSKVWERRAERMRRMPAASGRPRRSGRARGARRAGGRTETRRDAAESVLRARGVARLRRPRRRPKLPVAIPALSRVVAGAAVCPPGSRPGAAPARARRSLVLVRLLKRDARRATRRPHIARGQTAQASRGMQRRTCRARGATAMPGVPRARVSQMRRGRISAKSLWVAEHLVDRVEARRARVGLWMHDCGVGDVPRRGHGAPTFSADGRDRQRRLGRTEERKS